mmetsp:Transcript_42440/g.62370  ORF Transcript_42440/g.62370 Transcript_42440/m.62370 type:complete len:108 (+) Transcript_42440:286-609(+)
MQEWKKKKKRGKYTPKILMHCQENSTRKVEQIYTFYNIAPIRLLVLFCFFSMFSTLLGENNFAKNLYILVQSNWVECNWNVLGRDPEHSAKHKEEVGKGPRRGQKQY